MNAKRDVRREIEEIKGPDRPARLGQRDYKIAGPLPGAAPLVFKGAGFTISADVFRD
jgi:hypothetical protein